MSKSGLQQKKVRKSLTETNKPDTMGLRIKKQRSGRPNKDERPEGLERAVPRNREPPRSKRLYIL